MSTIDVIDTLAGIAPGSFLDQARRKRPAARENAQKSYDALFDAADQGSVSRSHRLAVAYFVTGLHRDAAIADFYRDQLNEPGLVTVVSDEIRRGEAQGPYGDYPAGPLSDENKDGLTYRAATGNRAVLGDKLVAALEHAHFLVFRPRDASPDKLQTLLDAGWSTTDVVTLSQLVAFLSFQIRVIAGFRTLVAAGASSTQTATAAE